jgi:drug/metabolite transporter (DMT)-like permease
MKIRLLWIITALLGFIGCGLMGVIQKIFIKNNPHLSLQLFLIPAFAFVVILGSLFLALLYLFNKKKAIGDKNLPQTESKESVEKIEKKNKLFPILFTLFLGVTLGVVHTVNTHLTGAFPSYITFPVINGGMIVATSIFSFLYFKEQLSKKKIFGLFTSIIGIILLSIG